METYIYVDGFNLNYGAVKGTSYKWLDLSALFNDILGIRHNISKIKYFTSRVSARQNDLSKPLRQDIYLKALKASCANIEIYYGKFLTHNKRLPLSDDNSKIVSVVKTEEKGTDVNLAVHLLNDA